MYKIRSSGVKLKEFFMYTYSLGVNIREFVYMYAYISWGKTIRSFYACNVYILWGENYRCLSTYRPIMYD